MSRIKLSTPLPAVLTDWLGDVFPAWIQLPPDAFYNLIPFNGAASPIKINYIGNAAELARSRVFTNLKVFLTLISERRVQSDPDCQLTSDSLELLLATTDWPGLDLVNTEGLPRPLREDIIGPLDFLKALAIECDLINVEVDRIEIRENGRRILRGEINLPLVRRVFEAAFSKVDPRNLTKVAAPWVHEQSGVVLWALSITADTARSPEELTRYCFVPPMEFFEKPARRPIQFLDIFMRSVFLSPLIWFGLLETQVVACTDANQRGLLYKKTAALYFGTWANPTRLMIFSYCEGDTTLKEAGSPEEFAAELREIDAWNRAHGYGPAWIDPGYDPSMKAVFEGMGLAEMLY